MIEGVAQHALPIPEDNPQQPSDPTDGVPQQPSDPTDDVPLREVTLVSRPTAKQHHVICGNRLFGGEWLEVHNCRIYCIRKIIIEFYDNVTLPSTQLGIGGKGKLRAN